MLNWYWIEDGSVCVFTVNGEEIERCDDNEFDKVHDRLASKYPTRR